MVEGFLRDMGGDRFEPLSAGAEAAAALDPDAVAAMLEAGIDISGQRPRKVDPFIRERVSYPVTLRDREMERTCPIFPGAFWRLKWPIDNPATAGDREQHRALVRRARDEIREYVRQFVREHSQKAN
jgi:arsenate reductase